MNSNMSIYLSMEKASLPWSEEALMSASDKGITLHLLPDSLERVQQGARAIVQQGIRSVSLQGEGWTLDRCWSFWLGFRSPKFRAKIQWPTTLDKEQETQLFKSIKMVDWVRDTINLPAQDLSPKALAVRSIDLLTELAPEQIQYQLIKGESLQEKGYSGLYNVGKGSSQESVLLTVDFNPTQNADEPVFACLVGKGITFDSGGYSIKESSYMNSMKSDMGGAALCVGAFGLAILNGLNKRVKLMLCCAENMINGRALKLGDIIHYRNGKTVEVMNTDAEGRLVLADGLIDATVERPQIIIDCATLTGAAKVAVGGDYHSVFSFNDELASQLLTAAEQMNEGFWRLPLAEKHRTQLPSNFADLSNIAAPNYTAGASTAAGFLSHFVESYQTNWIHIDCSATYQKSANSLWSAGATGLGVKTLSHFILQFAQQAE